MSALRHPRAVRLRNLAVGTAAGSLLLVGLAASPASAGAWGYVAFANANSGKCLEIGGWAQNNGATANQWDCLHGSAASNGWFDENQVWTVNVVNGYTQIRNVNSGKCLEVQGWAQNNGATVDQWDCLYDGNGNPDKNQAWYIAGSGQIWNVNSGKCLEIGGWAQNNGALADQWDCLNDGNGNPDSNQVWQQTHY
ncbi:RICIN domain-containing protein [Streptacidiphilus jiangxiensis]|uniref:Ricin-type beta-trefoil lectin domain-like n=1 Tax=Streptacidiphilus jiangxiensis TaxID=235985 RepID=A0A1H7PB15_STRJI|nr:RICIN domain-containing protein [Streptacidiphilus jiangxiensis]SEL32961.1 Ricin-type beta-trefoil lectin domain-like [Streptacidiphilus jiangxiensis]